LSSSNVGVKKRSKARSQLMLVILLVQQLFALSRREKRPTNVINYGFFKAKIENLTQT
jgi:hypothetical protein